MLICNANCLSVMLISDSVFHISILVMNRLNTTESAIFISLVYSLLPKDLTIQNSDNLRIVGILTFMSRKKVMLS